MSRFHYEVARTILHAGNVAVGEANQVMDAVLLLQQGLALHDRVDEESGLRRQLHVLAGDFCSGQYYKILAQVKNQPLLIELCAAVMKINESKMALYHSQQNGTGTNVMDLLEVIEGELLFALARHYLKDATGWFPQIRSLVRAHIVKEQMVIKKASKYFTARQAYEWIGEAIEQMMHIQPNAIFQPIAAFITEYLAPAQKTIEAQTYAEGNR